VIIEITKPKEIGQEVVKKVILSFNIGTNV